MLTLPARAGRTAVAGFALLAATTVLSACDKPLLTITAFNGSTAKVVSAQPKCVLGNGCAVKAGKVANITATAGSQILIDVPKKLADAGWLVAAYSTDTSGKNTPIQGAGTEGVRRDHSVRLNVPLTTGGYLLQVGPVKPKDQLSTWLIAVQLKQ